MSLSKEQKDKLFSLIHEVMDKNSELEKVCNECGPLVQTSTKNFLKNSIIKNKNSLII